MFEATLRENAQSLWSRLCVVCRAPDAFADSWAFDASGGTDSWRCASLCGRSATPAPFEPGFSSAGALGARPHCMLRSPIAERGIRSRLAQGRQGVRSSPRDTSRRGSAERFSLDPSTRSRGARCGVMFSMPCSSFESRSPTGEFRKHARERIRRNLRGCASVSPRAGGDSDTRRRTGKS
jgi:hypothetical protein